MHNTGNRGATVQMSCIDGHWFESDGAVQTSEHELSVTYTCLECGETLEDRAEI